MKITRFKSRLALGSVFALSGLVLVGSAVIASFEAHKSHGWGNIIQQGVMGVALLIVGVGLCFDKEPA